MVSNFIPSDSHVALASYHDNGPFRSLREPDVAENEIQILFHYSLRHSMWKKTIVHINISLLYSVFLASSVNPGGKFGLLRETSW